MRRKEIGLGGNVPATSLPRDSASVRRKEADSLKTGGKESPAVPTFSGKASTAENSNKTGKAGKSAFARKPSKEIVRIEDEIPKGAKCLMDCEAAVILDGIQEQLHDLSDDPTIEIPKSFDQGFHYANSSTSYSKPESVKQVREILSTYNLSDVEICLIGNICPETVDEVYSLVPSLKKSRMQEGTIKDMLANLAKLKDAK